MSTYLPDAAHWPALLATIAVAALLAGFGFLCGVRRADDGLITGWAGASVLSHGFGLSGCSIRLALEFSLLLGLLGLGLRLVRPLRTFSLGSSARVALLGVPFLILVESVTPSFWDDFSHWLLNAHYLFVKDHYPTLAEPVLGSIHPAYPYGLAFVSSAALLFTGTWSESISIYWNAILILCAATTLSAILEDRLRPKSIPGSVPRWACAGLAIVACLYLNPGFRASVSMSCMTDNATAVVMLTLFRALFIDRVPDRFGTALRSNAFRVAAAACVVLVVLRQLNPLIVAVVYGSATLALLIRHGRRSVQPVAILLVSTIPAIAVTITWQLYAMSQIADGQFAVLPLSEWHWAQGLALLKAIGALLARKPGFYLLTLVLGLVALRRLTMGRSDGTPTRLAAHAAFVTLVLCLVLIPLYLGGTFAGEEVARAASFDRYSQYTSFCLLAALALMVPATSTRALLQGQRGAALCAGLVFAVCLYPRWFRHDGQTILPAITIMADEIERQMTPGTPITLIDPTGDGYEVTVLAYKLFSHATALGHDLELHLISLPNGLNSQTFVADQKLVSGLIWIASGVSMAKPYLGPGASPSCTYLVALRSGATQLTHAWPRDMLKDPHGTAAKLCRTEDTSES